MEREQHGPPPGLSEEERRQWERWRRFMWLPGDIVITKQLGDKKTEESADEGRDRERATGSED